jgi:hypothetical protein
MKKVVARFDEQGNMHCIELYEDNKLIDHEHSTKFTESMPKVELFSSHHLTDAQIHNIFGHLTAPLEMA